MKRGCPISGSLFFLCKNEGANLEVRHPLARSFTHNLIQDVAG